MFRADEEDDYDAAGPGEEAIDEDMDEDVDVELEEIPHASRAAAKGAQESPSKVEGGENENEDDDGWDELDELDRDDDEAAGTYEDDHHEEQGEEEAGTAQVDYEAVEAERKRGIVMAMTEQQLERYESFRRSSLARPSIKKARTPGGKDTVVSDCLTLAALVDR